MYVTQLHSWPQYIKSFIKALSNLYIAFPQHVTTQIPQNARHTWL